MTDYNTNSFKIAIVWISLLLAAHLSYIYLPSINYEFCSIEAMRSILDPTHPIGIEKYLQIQANPLGYSLIGASINLLFFLKFNIFSARISSLLGFVLLMSSFTLFPTPLNREKKNQNSFYLILGLSPLIWLFSGRATEDILPAGLVFFSFGITWISKNRPNYLFGASLLFGLALISKYNSALVGLGYLYIIYLHNQKKIDKQYIKLSALFLIPAGMIFISYLAIIYFNYGIFLYPKKFRPLLKFDPMNFPNILSQYLFYLGISLSFLFIFPIIGCYQSLQKKRWIILPFLLGVLFSFIPIFLPYKEGEMNFGVLDKYLTEPILLLIRIIGSSMTFYLFVDFYFHFKKKTEPFLMFMLLTIVPYLVISSFVRPAQRYLIFVIPMIYFYICLYKPIFFKYFRMAFLLTIISFMGLDIALTHYQIVLANATNQVTLKAQELGIINRTEPGEVTPHTLNSFWEYESIVPKVYEITISPQPNQKIIHREDIRFFGKTIKTLYIIKKG